MLAGVSSSHASDEVAQTHEVAAVGASQIVLGGCGERHDLDVAVTVKLRLGGEPGLHRLGSSSVSLESQQLASRSVIHEEEVTHVSIVVARVKNTSHAPGQTLELVDRARKSSEAIRNLLAERRKVGGRGTRMLELLDRRDGFGQRER